MLKCVCPGSPGWHFQYISLEEGQAAGTNPSHFIPVQPWMPSWHLPGEELLALAHPSPFTGSVPAQLSLLPYSPRLWHRQGGRLTAHCGMEVPPSQPNSAGNSLEQLACRELFCRSQFPLRPCTACEREEVLLKTSKTIY